jgi:predicted Zn finger-like uncharacterized protein
MYTQCLKCQTVFHITLEQLRAHDGVVRCGHCGHVFNADQQLFDDIPEQRAPAAKKARANSAKAKPVKPKTAAAAPAPARKPARPTRKSPPAPVSEEIDAAPPPWSPPRTEKQRSGAPARDGDASISEQLLAARPARRRFSGWWLLGIVLLTASFGAQAVYFYRDQLARFPETRPYLLAMCAQLGCSLQPPYDAARIELVQPTNIAPHARFANALRLRATLVNRAERPQPHPLMHVTLTDRGGGVLSRRTFAPEQYLEQHGAAGSEMPPHLAVSALLDLVNPNGKAVGYQIDFSAPHMDVPRKQPAPMLAPPTD